MLSLLILPLVWQITKRFRDYAAIHNKQGKLQSAARMVRHARVNWEPTFAQKVLEKFTDAGGTHVEHGEKSGKKIV